MNLSVYSRTMSKLRELAHEESCLCAAGIAALVALGEGSTAPQEAEHARRARKHDRKRREALATAERARAGFERIAAEVLE